MHKCGTTCVLNNVLAGTKLILTYTLVPHMKCEITDVAVFVSETGATFSIYRAAVKA